MMVKKLKSRLMELVLVETAATPGKLNVAILLVLKKYILVQIQQLTSLIPAYLMP
jgi:hypothetical protein